jgi:hypothetical protein
MPEIGKSETKTKTRMKMKTQRMINLEMNALNLAK